MTESMSIRRAAEADIPAIVRICKDSMRETYGEFLDREAIEPWAHGDEVDRYVEGMWGKMTVADRGARLWGWRRWTET